MNCLFRILCTFVFLSVYLSYPFLTCAESVVGNQAQLQSASESDYSLFSIIKQIAMKLEGFEQNFCFAVLAGKHQLLAELNKGLAVLYLNGTDEILYHKWFGQIFPPPERSIGPIAKELLIILVPLLLILAICTMWYPKRLVAKRTQDTGCGIDPRIIGSIFDPYFTAKNHGDGTGLGLAVTYVIIHEMAGDIVVESEPGKGSTFTVFLPIADQVLQETSTEGHPQLALPGGDQHILLVDDEGPILKMTTRILEGHGYTVTAEDNGWKALEISRNNPMAYDLVLSDVSMPKITGDQLAGEILSIRPDIPVLLASGYIDTIIEQSVREGGIKGLLQKPLAEKQLLTAIQQALILPKDKPSIPLYPLT